MLLLSVVAQPTRNTEWSVMGNSVLRRDAAALVLVRRSGGRTEWAFADRAASVVLSPALGRLAKAALGGLLGCRLPERLPGGVEPPAADRPLPSSPLAPIPAPCPTATC